MISDAHWLCAHQSLAGRSSIGYEEFRRFFAGAEAHPIDVDGQPAGLLFVVGDEVHACPLPAHRGRWLTRRLLRVLAWVIERHGRAVTRAESAQGIEFVLRLGFKPRGEFYILEVADGR